MNKFQKADFIMSAVIFICLGLIFIIFGLKYDSTVLKFMGYCWIPDGLLQLTLVLYILYKKKELYGESTVFQRLLFKKNNKIEIQFSGFMNGIPASGKQWRKPA
jgi:hypothetical protein